MTEEDSQTISTFISQRHKEMTNTHSTSMMFGHRKLRFATPVDDRFVCSLCGKIMQEPIQTLRGLVACKTCYDGGREMVGDLCPLDAEKIDVENFTRPDKFIARDISKLKVHCIYDKCDWIGALNDINDHENTSCDHAYSHCGTCDDDVLIKDLKQHQLECSTFTEQSYTKPINVSYHKQNSKDFMNSQLMDQINSILAENNKLRTECSENMKTSDETRKKLDQSRNEVTELKSQMQQINSFISEQNETITNLKKKLGDALKMTEDLHPENFYQVKINNLETKQKQLIENISSIDNKPIEPNQLTKVYEGSEHIKKLEHEQALFNANLADIELKVNLLEKLSSNGHQIWKIDNFTYRLNQAINQKVVALHSPPCYTSSINGYKFSIRVYPNGDGIGLNTHISIYFVLMKNHYDNLLEWPFQRKVTFKLINVKNPSMTKKETFVTDKKSSSFQKPEKEMNIAAGCPRFLSKERLHNEGFIVDDSIYVEAIVEDA